MHQIDENKKKKFKFFHSLIRKSNARLKIVKIVEITDKTNFPNLKKHNPTFCMKFVLHTKVLIRHGKKYLNRCNF